MKRIGSSIGFKPIQRNQRSKFFFFSQVIVGGRFFSLKMEQQTVDGKSFAKLPQVNTQVIRIQDIFSFRDEELEPAVKLLHKGEVIAIPTETVYGLAANAFDPHAVEKIFTTKGRPSDNPLIVHISSLEMLKDLVEDGDTLLKDPILRSVIEKFWPGPITFLLPKSSKVPNIVTAGLDKVAVRMPSHPVAKRIIELSNLPLAAPSANLSGKPSPTTAEHVIQDLEGKIYCVVDGGSTQVGLESTVVDLISHPPLILRPGGVTFEQLHKLVPDIQVYEKKVHGSQLEAKPPTPGLKYKHYSPLAKVILFEEEEEEANKLTIHLRVNKVAKEYLSQNKKVGIIQTHSERYSQLEGEVLMIVIGDEHHPEEVARGLFGALRELDSKKVDVILVEGISEKNEGLAVMNRIRKAASEFA